MKKIWIWNHYATGMYFDRGGRHYYFAKYLRNKGYDVSIFCATTLHNSDGRLFPNKELFSVKYLDGIKFVFVRSTPYKGNGFRRVLNMLRFYQNLKRSARKIREREGSPELILASSVHPLTLVAGVQMAKKFEVPCICEVRDLWPEAIFALQSIKENGILGKILTAGEHWIYRQANALIFTKEGDTDYIKEKKWNTEQGGNIDLGKAFYINNGVDLEFFDRAINEYQISDEDLKTDKFKVVYAGALRTVNNVDNIIDAANILKKEENISFLIYGEGDQKPALENKILSNNLSNVTLKGYVNKKYIPYILSKSDLNILNYSSSKFVLKRGNSSNKLFEYMASGKPILANVRFAYSIIEKFNCGYELSDDTAEEFAKTIKHVRGLSKDQYESLGANARRGAQEFDFQVLTDKLLKAMDYVCNGILSH